MTASSSFSPEFLDPFYLLRRCQLEPTAPPGPPDACEMEMARLDMAWIEGSVVAALRARFVDPVGWTDL